MTTPLGIRIAIGHCHGSMKASWCRTTMGSRLFGLCYGIRYYRDIGGGNRDLCFGMAARRQLDNFGRIGIPRKTSRLAYNIPTT